MYLSYTELMADSCHCEDEEEEEEEEEGEEDEDEGESNENNEDAEEEKSFEVRKLFFNKATLMRRLVFFSTLSYLVCLIF